MKLDGGRDGKRAAAPRHRAAHAYDGNVKIKNAGPVRADDLGAEVARAASAGLSEGTDAADGAARGDTALPGETLVDSTWAVNAHAASVAASQGEHGDGQHPGEAHELILPLVT